MIEDLALHIPEVVISLIICGSALYIVISNNRSLYTFGLVVLVSTVVFCIYGIINDQLSYTISPEFFTAYKFYRYHLVTGDAEIPLSGIRLWVALTGMISACKMGVIIGAILGAFAPEKINKGYQVFIGDWGAVLTSALTAVIGFVYGKLLAEKGVDWHLPENLVDIKNFIVVAMMLWVITASWQSWSIMD